MIYSNPKVLHEINTEDISIDIPFFGKNYTVYINFNNNFSYNHKQLVKQIKNNIKLYGKAAESIVELDCSLDHSNYRDRFVPKSILLNKYVDYTLLLCDDIDNYIEGNDYETVGIMIGRINYYAR